MNSTIMHTDCLYYQAYIPSHLVVSFTALFRSMEDHLAFERIDNKHSHIFEFFVPSGMENRFLDVMDILQKEKLCERYWKENIDNSSIYKKIGI